MAQDDEHKPTTAEKGKGKAPAINGDGAVNGTSKSKDHKDAEGKGGKDGKDEGKPEQGE